MLLIDKIWKRFAISLIIGGASSELGRILSGTDERSSTFYWIGFISSMVLISVIYYWWLRWDMARKIRQELEQERGKEDSGVLYD